MSSVKSTSSKDGGSFFSKDGRIIGLFLFFEIIIFAIITVLTFVPSVRKTILARNVSTRAEALKKGYGYYSDPEIGECFTESGNCETVGTRFVYQRCIPNFENGREGVGCIDEKTGLFTYNMIIEEQTCNQQCYSDNMKLEDNIGVSKRDNGTLVVTNVGTHQLLDKDTGLVVTDFFIGDFDPTDMTYKLKNCIENEKKYVGFKERKYTCQTGTQGGATGCVYACGSDPTLNFNASTSENSQQFLGSIPFPFYTTEGTKVFVCKDIQDNNVVEMFNHGQTISKDFVLPDKCYNHINLIPPPTTSEGGDVLTISQNTRYDVTDRYIYLKKDVSDLSPYFQLDYNYLNNLRTYVKIISNDETMLLSRLYSGDGGIQSIYKENELFAYIAIPKTIFTEDQINTSTTVTFSGTININNVPLLKSKIVDQGDYYYIPFSLFQFFDNGSVSVGTGNYIFDEPEGLLYMQPTGLDTNTSYYYFIKYENSTRWIPGIFKSTFNDTDNAVKLQPSCEDQWCILNNDLPGYVPSDPSGGINFYAIPFGKFSVTLDSGGTNNFNMNLTSLIITGPIFVDNFNMNADTTQILPITKTVDSAVGFYIRGTPTTGSPSSIIGKNGFYYPLYLSKPTTSQTFNTIVFEEYGDLDFYSSADITTLPASFVTGAWNNYDYLRGVATISISTISVSIDYGPGGTTNPFSPIFWSSPSLISPGQGYTADQNYTIGETNSTIFVDNLQENGNVLLEVNRNGDPLFDGFEMNEILEGQTRTTIILDPTKQTTKTYQISIYPEKILQVERNFGNFLGPYSEDRDGKRTFVCTDPTGTPLPDGELIEIKIGETITALVQDFNFNTNPPSQCGVIKVIGDVESAGTDKLCQESRKEGDIFVSDACIIFNPDGNYVGVQDFLEDGYVLEDENKLGCFLNGAKVDDNRCSKPFLTGYYESDIKYDIGQELILNNGDIETYISLVNDNNQNPNGNNWATFSRIQTGNFNVGQYLGQKQTYITTRPGNIFMDMDYKIKYLSMLKYRTDNDYGITEAYIVDQGIQLDSLKGQFNVVTPYLVSPKNDDVRFTMTNNNSVNPIIEVSLPGQDLEDRIFLEENYVNILLWYMSAPFFLDNKISGTTDLFSDFKDVSFVALGQNGVTLDILNNGNNMGLWGSGQKGTITVNGKKTPQPQNDITGYYCYFIPFLASDALTDTSGFDCIYPYQWLAYILNLYTTSDMANINPCKFEVVYVNDIDNDQQTYSLINITRNITQIPDSERFTFIDKPTTPSRIDAVLGLFLPFSKLGPFPRLHQLSPQKTFTIQFTMPSGYQILTQNLKNGVIPVTGDEPNKVESFFNYGYSGFTIEDNFSSPGFSTSDSNSLVQYNQTQGRTCSMTYVKKFRVTSDNNIYMSQVGGDLIYRTGDVITIAGYDFNVVGRDAILLFTGNSDTYEIFDYQLQVNDISFIQNYNNDLYFKNYVKYQTTDRILPDIYNPSSGNFEFVLRWRYDPSDLSIVNIIPSLVSNPAVPGPEITVNIDTLSFLRDPEDEDNIGDAGQFIRLINQGQVEVSVIKSINIDNLGVITATQVSGKPYGRMSFAGEITNNYNSAIAGRSFITQFTSTNSKLTPGDRYEIDGYNFGVQTGQLATVNMIIKSYTPDLPTYTGNESIISYGDIYLFTDFRNRLTYRNQGQVPTTFDPTNISSDVWADYGQINPQVDYKLYHDGAVYEKGDVVEHDRRLWKAVSDVPLAQNRDPPYVGNSDWSLNNPMGGLFSPLNLFTAALTDLSDTNPSKLAVRVTSAGDTHIFPSPSNKFTNYYTGEARFVFNTIYTLDVTGTPPLYLSSGGTVMDGKFNFTENNYILELRYFIDDLEISRDEYLAGYSTGNKVEILIQMRRGETSLLTQTLFNQVNTLQFGATSATSEGEILFVSGTDELSQRVEELNTLDDQNIPIRLGDYGSLGYCFKECSKSVSDSYGTTPFGYLSFLGDNLLSTYFNNRLRVWTPTSSNKNKMISLSNEPCNQLLTPDQRYLIPCVGNTSTISGTDQYSQYLFEIPVLDKNIYGVQFCGSTGPGSYDSFLYANSVFLYLVPMDIDSQNLLKLVIKDASSKIINRVRYFHFYDTSGGAEVVLTPNSVNEKVGCFMKDGTDTYVDLPNQITISLDNQTRITNNGFGKDILTTSQITLVNGNDTITMTPTVFGLDFQFSITDGNQKSEALVVFNQWWLNDENLGAISHGFFWPFDTVDPSAPVTQANIVKLSFVPNLLTYRPGDLTLNFIGNSDGNLYQIPINNLSATPYTIEDFTLTPNGSIDMSAGVRTFTAANGGPSVSVYFDGTNMYQPGDYGYTSPDDTKYSTGDEIYQKWRGNECITKGYLNYGSYNGTMTYRTSGGGITTESGTNITPIIFDRTKKGPLSLSDTSISLVSGDSLISTDDIINTFVISDSGMVPNPIQKPLNLSQSSSFYPDLYKNKFPLGVISSGMSDNLFGTPISNYDLEDYGDAIDYLKGIDDEDQNSYLTNSEFESFSYRQNLSRANYPNEHYECNIILPPRQSNLIQAVYKLKETSTGAITGENGEMSISVRTNNYFHLNQNNVEDPLQILSGTTPITAERTSYSGNQFLTIEYYLDQTKVAINTYQDITTFQAATERYISIIYETEYTTNTSPVLTSLNTKNVDIGTDSLTISIVENS